MVTHQASHQTKVLMLLPVVGILLALLFGVAMFVRPAYAATPTFIECPANGDGPEKELTGTIDALGQMAGVVQMAPYDEIVISVTSGTECLFTLKEPFVVDKNGPNGLPIINHDVLIRAVGGRAIIERWVNAPEFRLIETNANLTLENITLRNGLTKKSPSNEPASGGAILAHQALTLTNVVISGNVSYRGGGVFVEGSLALNQVSANDNQTRSAAPSDGGAIFVGGDLSATAITVTHNFAVDCGCGPDTAKGGGIFISGTAVIANAQFQNNKTTYNDGGALYVTGDLTLTSSSFYSNSAGFRGGGIFAGGDLKLASSGFISNFAYGDGGGLYMDGTSSVTESLFFSNVVHQLGGGLATGENVTVTVEGNSFRSNVAQNGGGAAIGRGIVHNNLFEANVATWPQPVAGGGGLLAGFQATIQNNRFINNSASSGGGVHLLFYPLYGSPDSETANSLAIDQGATANDVPSAKQEAAIASSQEISPGDTSQIINNLFIDNQARGSNGAAIASGINIDGAQGGLVQISHNTIVRKTLDDDSALYIAKSSAHVADNIITQYGIGIQAVNAPVIAIANLIEGAAVNYIGVANPANGLTADPLFVDPAHNNYQLQPRSPARDSGIDIGVISDIDGGARPQGKGFDRGAFEFINHAPVAQTESYTTPVDTPLVVAAPGLLANDSDPDGDVVTVTVTAPPLHGVLSLKTNGAFIYTPTAAFSGTDSFTYRANDAAKFSGATVVPIHVSGDETTQSVEIAGLKANISGPVVVGRAVNFAATVEAGNNIDFVWDFGDGAGKHGPAVSHVYAQAGDYNVTLTASNSLGIKEATTQVTIQPAQQGQLHMSLPLLAK